MIHNGLKCGNIYFSQSVLRPKNSGQSLPVCLPIYFYATSIHTRIYYGALLLFHLCAYPCKWVRYLRLSTARTAMPLSYRVTFCSLLFLRSFFRLMQVPSLFFFFLLLLPLWLLFSALVCSFSKLRCVLTPLILFCFSMKLGYRAEGLVELRHYSYYPHG